MENNPDIDKLIHSSVGLGIKLGQSYSLLIGVISTIITYYFGLLVGLITLLILVILSILRGALLAGIIKEYIDKYIRKTKYDPEDIKATQNSNIVIKWYKNVLSK